MINADILGRFVWHELMTTDADAAGEFYPQVTGWEAQSWENDPSYTLWMSPGGPMGGVMSLPADEGESETPPHWLPYIGTSDIDATVEAAQRLGGRVEKDITDVASIGRFAVLSDPQGAMFAVLEPAEDSSGGAGANGGTPPVGGFSWHELATSDYEAAFQFYQELFGWEKDAAHDMGGDLGTYLLFSHGGGQVGGMYNKASDASGPASWLCYVRVKAAADAAEAAKAAGGQVAHGPMEVPGGDVVAQIIDPQGAAFAVHERKQAADAGKPAKPKRSKKKKPEPVMAEEAAVESASAPDMEEDEEEAELEEVSARPARKSAGKSRSSAKPAAAKAKGGGGKKTAGKKAAAKKAAAKKVPAKKAPAKKAPAKKAPAKKAAGKKTAAKAPARKAAKKSAGTRSAVARGKGAGGRSARTSPTKSAASKRPAASKGAARKKR